MDDDTVRRYRDTQAQIEQLLIESEQLRGRSEAAQRRSQALHQRSQELMECSRALLERCALDQAPHDQPAPAEDQGGAEHR